MFIKLERRYGRDFTKPQSIFDHVLFCGTEEVWRNTLSFSNFSKNDVVEFITLSNISKSKNYVFFACLFLILGRKIWNNYNIFKLTGHHVVICLIVMSCKSCHERLFNLIWQAITGPYEISSFSPGIIKSEAHSETCQTSKMKLFAKSIDGWKLSIIFRKKLDLRCLSGL